MNRQRREKRGHFARFGALCGVALLPLIGTWGCSSSSDHGLGFQAGGSGGTVPAGGRTSNGGSSANTGTSGSSGKSAEEAGSDASGAAGESDSAGAAGEADTAGSSGRTSSAGASGTPSSAGAAGNASGGSGSAGAGSAGADSSGGGPATVCGTTAHWVDGSALSISTPSDDHFGSISSDELSIAWATSANDVATIHYADRNSIGDAFASAKQLTGAFALDRAALSPDGLTLVLVTGDRRGFAEYRRDSRSDDFAPPVIGLFSSFDNYAADTMPTGNGFGDPLLAPDNKTFIYSEFGPGVVDTVHQTKRLFDADPWQVGLTWAATELRASGASRRRPTGLSADGRTLFFWDEQQSQERAGFVVYQGVQFASFVDLGPLIGAQPNDNCTLLYHAGPGTLSRDLFAASAQ